MMMMCDADTVPTISVKQLNYTVGCNSWTVPILEYLNIYLQYGEQRFVPSIQFQYLNGGLYTASHDAATTEFDFMLQNAYRSACVESEMNAITLATMARISFAPPNETFIETKYGAVFYTLKDRTDIRKVEDVQGKIIGTNRFNGLATHLCYDLMLRHGIHFLQDPKQTIFYKNSEQALQAVLDGIVDVGCAATGALEAFVVNETTGELFDWENTLHILDPQSYTLDDDDETPFPHVISTPLVSSYPFLAFPHVPTIVQLAVQETLLKMKQHAEIAPYILDCLDDRQCFVNNTECVDECYTSLDICSIAIPTTTAQQALDAHFALEESGLGGFTKPISNLVLRDIQEKTGFLIKDDSVSSSEDSKNGRCVRFDSILDAITCPPGHFVRTSEEILNKCNETGLECYGQDCICQPCVKAYEVDVFTTNIDDDDVDEPVLTVPSRGAGCPKFAVCGRVQQEHILRIYAMDNVGRFNATVKGAFLTSDDENYDDDELSFTFERTTINGTDVFHYDFVSNKDRIGPKIVKISINGDEIPESPFRLLVTERDCTADTGHSQFVPDEFGVCMCPTGMIEIGENCVKLQVLYPSILIPLVILLAVAVFGYVRFKQKQSDAIWRIKPEELTFEENPRVLGRGTFGVVLLAEYRGTPVAVKRVLYNGKKPSSLKKSIERGPEQMSQRGSSNGQNNTIFDNDRYPPINNSNDEMLEFSSTHDFTQTKMAKKIGTKKLTTMTTQRDFANEMRLLSKLRHPSITTIMGAVKMADESMMVMEFMYFGSLHELLRNENILLERPVLIRMIIEVANGLRFLHSAKPQIIHGDLKAKNILVDERFRAKVSDFGLAGHKGYYGAKHATGTPLFMAPELIRGVSHNTPESDVYSFGMVLYEVFSRKDPYEGEHSDDLLRLIVSKTIAKRPPIPPDTPPQIASLMKACWEGEPSARPKASELDIRLRMMGLYVSDEE